MGKKAHVGTYSSSRKKVFFCSFNVNVQKARWGEVSSGLMRVRCYPTTVEAVPRLEALRLEQWRGRRGRGEGSPWEQEGAEWSWQSCRCIYFFSRHKYI